MVLISQVRLFDVSLDSLSFLRGFEAQEGRVLSLAWHPSGEHMAVGGADSIIRKYDIKNGRCLLRITLDDFKSRSTLVWDIKFLSDSTIVSADSLGKVQLWSGKHGTLIQSFHLHLADVLTLAVSAGEDEIYSSGVDAKILCIHKAKSKGSKWVKSGEVRSHTHDVRALVLSSSGLLASGGVDTQLIVCPTESFDVDSCTRYHPFPDSSRFFSVAPKANVLMLQSSSSLKFWQLSAQHRVGSDTTPTLSTSAASTSSFPHLHLNGGGIDSEAESSASEASRFRTKSSRNPVATVSSSTSPEKHPFLHCTNGMPVNFLEIKCKDPGFILSSSLSSDASHVALSTVDRLWLYSVEHRTLTASCIKQANLPCYKMSFTTDRRTLILATVDQGVKIVDISDHGNIDFESSRSLSIGKRSADDNISPPRHPVVDFELNSDCSMIATISSHRKICLCNLQTGELLRKLPRLGNQPIAFSFHPSNRALVLFAGGSEREMYSYDISGDHLHLIGNLQMVRKYDGRSKLSHPSRMLPLQQPKSDLFAVYDNDCIILIRCKIPEASSSYKKSQATSSSRKRKSTSYKGEPLNYQLILSYQLVLFASSLTNDELVVVERPWSEVLNRLPPALERNRYGT